MKFRTIAAALAIALTSFAAMAADFPAPKEGTWIARDFKFHSGEVMPELRLAYTTVGEPSGEPVLVLHGTTGSAASMLSPAFGGELFGKDQPLDASKYYIIIPEAVGHGKSSKPSDGLRAKFPRYNYDDMVEAHYRRRPAKAPISLSPLAWQPPSKPTPTTTSTSGSPRATTTPRRPWSAFRPRCWPSMPPTMSAIPRKPASWSARSSA